MTNIKTNTSTIDTSDFTLGIKARVEVLSRLAKQSAVIQKTVRVHGVDMDFSGLHIRTSIWGLPSSAQNTKGYLQHRDELSSLFKQCFGNRFEISKEPTESEYGDQLYFTFTCSLS
tara:strand:+ start:6415 stop:6762 length:348 start_codon:yes stop_codon:yes gene_type:complete